MHLCPDSYLNKFICDSKWTFVSILKKFSPVFLRHWIAYCTHKRGKRVTVNREHPKKHLKIDEYANCEDIPYKYTKKYDKQTKSTMSQAALNH